ncbi:protein of unknown function [Pseudodesulfovibrio profundus]|uniref:Uncharacterized protein n=1 Tax=Pseudodesulfovibrio profundus TaxID=57320 RepID=A0A2C8FEQ4_9BACT|nr:hypothetical protein [Pseudodesulfovibrio profundus]SOB60647.1 protein of unknown function [Pseudodesulfovibrio profundus]
MDNALKSNVSRMVQAGVAEDKIKQYIKDYHAADRYLNENGSIMGSERGATDWGRVISQGVGGTIGGLIGAASPVPGDEFLAMGMGDAIGGLAWDTYRRHVQGKDQDKDIRDYMNSAAVDTGMGMAVPAGIDMAKPYVAKAVKGAVAPIKSRIARHVGKVAPSAADDVAMFERHGFKPDAGMVTDNQNMHTWSQSIRKTPGGGGVMGANDAHNMEQGSIVADKIARAFGQPQTPSVLGADVKTAASAKKEALKRQADELFKRAEQLIPDDMMVSAPNTREIVASLEAELADPATKPLVGGVNKIIAGIKKSMGETGELNARTMKNLKSLLGSVYSKPNADILDGKYKMLFKALRKDLDNVTSAVGPEAAEAMNKANSFYSKFKGDKLVGDPGWQGTLDELIRKANSSDTYKAIVNKAGGDSDKLRRIFQLLPEKQQANIRATVLQQMGKANPGAQNATGDAFSFNTFLTNINKLSPESRNFLFMRGGKPTAGYQDLLKVAEYMKNLEKAANHSNTDNLRVWRELWKPIGQGALLGGAGGGFGGSIPAMAKGAAVGAAVQGARIGADYRMAKLLTNPDFVKWLAQSGKAVSAPGRQISTTAQLAKLPIIAKMNPEIKDEIDAYLDNFDAPIKR